MDKIMHVFKALWRTLGGIVIRLQTQTPLCLLERLAS